MSNQEDVHRRVPVVGFLLLVTLGCTHEATPSASSASGSPFGTATGSGSSAGVSLTLPAGWTRATSSMTPYLEDPHEVAAVASFPLKGPASGAACDAQVPVAGVQPLAATDAFIWIVEWDTSGRFAPQYPAHSAPPRPDHFDLTAMSTFDCSATVPDTPGATFRTTSFSDRDRQFQVFVALGRDALSAREGQILSVLDSFHAA